MLERFLEGKFGEDGLLLESFYVGVDSRPPRSPVVVARCHQTLWAGDVIAKLRFSYSLWTASPESVPRSRV